MIGSPTSAMLATLESGEITATELLTAHLDQIGKLDANIGAFLELDVDGAFDAAEEVDRKRKAGEPLGALAGIPVAIKDNINIAGRPTTCASRILQGFISPYDAHVIEKLKAADAILIGKTNMDEFAMGSSTEHSALKTTRNPAHPAYVPGGSSGGSTAAVGAGMVPLALGSSTGGSIRQPASFCGVVGMKPTYGRVSRYGLVAFGSSLDQIGPCASDVEGAARLLKVIAGKDERDATSSQQATQNYPDQLAAPEKLRVGLVDEFQREGVQPEVAQSLNKAVTEMGKAGVSFEQVSFPHTQYCIPAYYLLCTAEASANLARFDGVRYGRRAQDCETLADMYVRSRGEGFGAEVKRRILLGTYCLSSGYYEGYYLNAQKVRTLIVEDFRRAFEKVDVILAPTCPSTAFRFGEKTKDPVSMYLSDIFTVMANLAGVPAISVPVGFDEGGLPIGLQLMAKHFDETTLFQAARLLEDVSPFQGKGV